MPGRSLIGDRLAETLTGAGDADLVAGMGGADRIEAGGGADTIAGGSGADVVLGGAGDDVIHGDSADQWVWTLGPATRISEPTGAPVGEGVVCALNNGGSVIVWTDAVDLTESPSDIRMQVLGADGLEIGSEIVVGATTLGSQFGPSVTALVGGGFVVAWDDWGGSPKMSWFQLFDDFGNPLRLEGSLQSTLYRTDFPALAALPDGGFIVAYGGYSDEGDEVRARRYDANGETVGGEISAATLAEGSLLDVSTKPLADGGYALFWQQQRFRSGAFEIVQRGQLFDADGNKAGTSFLVGVDGGADHVPDSALPWGGFVAIRTETVTLDSGAIRTMLKVQVHDEAGGLLGDEFSIVPPDIGGEFSAAVFVRADGSLTLALTVPGRDLGFHGAVYKLDLDLGLLPSDGGQGDDSLKGGAGDDSIYGGAGLDTLAGGGGADRLFGDAGDDRLLGKGGADRLSGGQGHDHLSGGGGADTLKGRGGEDTMLGGKGDDLVAGGAGNDRLDGAAGQDSLRGAGGEDSLAGGTGADLLRGQGGADRLEGDAGADSLQGGGGADTLQGGEGEDVLTGGAGADHFIFASLAESPNAGPDRITDFAVGVDKIDLTAFALVWLGEGAFTGTAAEVRLRLGFGEVRLVIDADGDRAADATILLAGGVPPLAGDVLL